MAQKKDVKLEDIAKELNISIVTVSNAIKDKKGVSQNLKVKILEKAKELGYKIKKKEKIAEKKSYYIGIVIAERYIKEFPSFYMDIYKRIAQETTKRGSFTILEIIDEEKERNLYSINSFSKMDVEGIIIIGEINDNYVRLIADNCKVPVVCVDYYGAEKDIDYIVTDSYGGMQILTQYLIDMGHKEIGFIGTINATNSIMDRYQGYCKALVKNNIVEKKEWIINDRSENVYDYKIDFDLPENMPTAFVCNCDRVAYILIEKLKKIGLEVPKDISVLGFDHYGYQEKYDIELVTYENDEKAIAQISVNRLIKKIEKNIKDGEIRIVEGKFVNGKTVLALK
ncbi:MAG: LacI family DNA-binding transcriptional regulator [Eubacteriales bacterium]|nr:LacI family DNA-binding transcriptional regulator [Eubacteriales bacterium]